MAEKDTDSRTKHFVSAVFYPVTMATGFLIFSQLQAFDAGVTFSAYLSVLICGLTILVYEVFLPYRAAWKPTKADIANDLAFMALVQIALPYLLGISLVVALSGFLIDRGITIDILWPHDFPVWFQMVLMLLFAEFPRYWLHRGFHKFQPMWRFHAVHHSPHRLYWANVGRFHPVEKTVQYCFDALPFAVLGVAPEVLAAYFVFYGINGFFQHSNCLVRLGWLNYLISGPELHRWHHSENPAESDNNFGNNLILWDVLFGTRYLPRNREVGSLGLLNRRYPTGFAAQMKTPFVRGLENG